MLLFHMTYSGNYRTEYRYFLSSLAEDIEFHFGKIEKAHIFLFYHIDFIVS